MPLPTLTCLAFASGLAAALAGRGELRVSPRAALLTQTYSAYALFVVLLLVPISVYFYLFHGDWFLLYLVDVRRVPSALALLGFFGEGALGTAGFLLGASLVRGQRERVAASLAGFVAVAGVAFPLALEGRIGVVGTYAQFHGGFGLTDYGAGALFYGTITMGLLLILGLVFLLVRLELAQRAA